MRVTDEATISIVDGSGGRDPQLLLQPLHLLVDALLEYLAKMGPYKAQKLMAVAKSSDSAIQKAVDLGFVGEPANIDVTVLDALMKHNLILWWLPLAAAKTAKPIILMPILLLVPFLLL